MVPRRVVLSVLVGLALMLLAGCMKGGEPDHAPLDDAVSLPDLHPDYEWDILKGTSLEANDRPQTTVQHLSFNVTRDQGDTRIYGDGNATGQVKFHVASTTNASFTTNRSIVDLNGQIGFVHYECLPLGSYVLQVEIYQFEGYLNLGVQESVARQDCPPFPPPEPQPTPKTNWIDVLANIDSALNRAVLGVAALLGTIGMAVRPVVSQVKSVRHRAARKEIEEALQAAEAMAKRSPDEARALFVEVRLQAKMAKRKGKLTAEGLADIEGAIDLSEEIANQRAAKESS